MTKNILVWSLAVSCLSISCSSRNIHTEATADPQILVREWARPTKFSWKAGERGAEYSSAVFYENTLIFGSTTQGLVSIYPGHNQVRWVLPIEGGVASEMLVHKDEVYFGGRDGFFYAVHAETGKVKWRYETRSPIMSRPTIAGGRLFVNSSDDTVYAFDASSGEWIWHYKRRSSPPATILGVSPPWVDQDDVWVGLSDGYLVTLNAQDGALKTQKKIHSGKKFTDVDAEIVHDAGVLFVPSYDGELYSIRKKDGEVLWKFEGGGSKKIVLEDQRIFLPSSEGTIYCLAKENAKVLWKFDLDGGAPTRLAVTPDYLIFGSTHQYLYVLDKASGRLLYRWDSGQGSGFYGSPTLDEAKKRFYILSGGGNLYAFSIRGKIQERPHGQTDPYKFYEPL